MLLHSLPPSHGRFVSGHHDPVSSISNQYTVLHSTLVNSYSCVTRSFTGGVARDVDGRSLREHRHGEFVGFCMKGEATPAKLYIEWNGENYRLYFYFEV